MIVSPISLRYAQALADVAGHAEQARQIQNQLADFGELLNEHRSIHKTTNTVKIFVYYPFASA